MLIPSHLQLEPSNSRTRVPAGGINLIASIDFESDESTTATLSSSTKVLKGEDAISRAQVATPNHSNQQYSIYAITDAAANIVERYAYTAYGQPTILNAAATVIATSAISNRYTYTAREWDATVGLHHFRARWMSGLTGRFLTRDPIGYRGRSWSVYQFCGGHALNLVDPSGKVSISTIEDTLSHPESDCGNSGKEFGMVYQFEVENKCPSGKGWIVQEVTVKCAVDKCKDSRNCPRTLPANSVHFFEAWRVTSGNTADGHPQFTDVATSYANDKTCGILRADGEVRFICDEDIQNVESPEHWQKDLDVFKRDPGPNCPVITSGGLPTSHDTPNWWGKSREASGKRFFQITWSKCCMCNIQQLGGPKQGSR